MRHLDVGALGDRDPRGVQPLRQLVAHPLELAQVQQSGIASPRALRVAQAAHGIGGQERVCQLMLQPGDLPANRAPGR